MCRLKRVGVILSTALVLSSFLPLTASANEVKIAGDVTCDGVVNLYDAIELSKCIMKDNNFSEEQLGVADYNADGNINLYDVIDIATLIMEDKETWQSAYLNVIEEECAVPDSMEYSLICIDDNEIPELIIHDVDDHAGGGVYTYSGGVIPVFGLGLRSLFMGYTENAFYVYSYATVDDAGLLEMHDYCTLSNGEYSFAEQLIKHGDSQYMADYIPITEDEYNEKLAQYQVVETEFEKYSYDEIKDILNK